MENQLTFEEKLEKICNFHYAKLDLLNHYMKEWVERRLRVPNKDLMNFELHYFEYWLKNRLLIMKAVKIYGQDVVNGNIAGMKFDVNIVPELHPEPRPSEREVENE